MRTVVLPCCRWYEARSGATYEGEATNRYEWGVAHPVKEDTVFTWADRCM